MFDDSTQPTDSSAFKWLSIVSIAPNIHCNRSIFKHFIRLYVLRLCCLRLLHGGMSVVKTWHNTRTVIFIAPSDSLSCSVTKKKRTPCNKIAHKSSCAQRTIIKTFERVSLLIFNREKNCCLYADRMAFFSWNSSPSFSIHRQTKRFEKWDIIAFVQFKRKAYLLPLSLAMAKTHTESPRQFSSNSILCRFYVEIGKFHWIDRRRGCGCTAQKHCHQ